MNLFSEIRFGCLQSRLHDYSAATVFLGDLDRGNGIPLFVYCTDASSPVLYRIHVGFESEASTATSDFVLQATETLSGPWNVIGAELVETADGAYFQVPLHLEPKQTFYRIWVSVK